MSKKNRGISVRGTLLAIAFAMVLTGPLSADENDAKAEQAIKALGGRVFRSPALLGNPEIPGLDATAWPLRRF